MLLSMVCFQKKNSLRKQMLLDVQDELFGAIYFAGITLLVSALLKAKLENSLEQSNQDLERLENKLGELIEQIRKLREENSSLQARQESLVAERAALVSKNDEARTKVEAMIDRLRTME